MLVSLERVQCDTTSNDAYHQCERQERSSGDIWEVRMGIGAVVSRTTQVYGVDGRAQERPVDRHTPVLARWCHEGAELQLGDGRGAIRGSEYALDKHVRESQSSRGTVPRYRNIRRKGALSSGASVFTLLPAGTRRHTLRMRPPCMVFWSAPTVQRLAVRLPCAAPGAVVATNFAQG